MDLLAYFLSPLLPSYLLSFLPCQLHSFNHSILPFVLPPFLTSFLPSFVTYLLASLSANLPTCTFFLAHSRAPFVPFILPNLLTYFLAYLFTYLRPSFLSHALPSFHPIFFMYFHSCLHAHLLVSPPANDSILMFLILSVTMIGSNVVPVQRPASSEAAQPRPARYA